MSLNRLFFHLYWPTGCTKIIFWYFQKLINPNSATIVWKCCLLLHLLNIFKCTSDLIFSWKQTIWTLIILLPGETIWTLMWVRIVCNVGYPRNRWLAGHKGLIQCILEIITSDPWKYAWTIQNRLSIWAALFWNWPVHMVHPCSTE